ncbi:MAG: DUF2141 domain-containing protein [Candidatus Kapaibacteriota bacterium]
MLHLTITILAMLCGFFALPLYSQTSGTITVLMRGMKSDHGVMRVALYAPQDNFLSDKPFRGTSTTIVHGEAQCIFENIPFGEYAISAFHDENANQKLDMGLFGPTEHYGFSNGARSFLPPPFEKAKVSFHDLKMTAIIEIK